MSFAHTAGSFAGKAAAYVTEGTRLGATSFAQGAKDGYASKSAELAARRALLTQAAPAITPRQRKLATAKA